MDSIPPDPQGLCLLLISCLFFIRNPYDDIEPAVKDITSYVRNSFHTRGAMRQQDINDLVLLLHRYASIDQLVGRKTESPDTAPDKTA